MSAIFIEGDLTHYEVIGRGQPVLFLHSWLGSWRTWMPTMEMIADRYRAYALDFWSFGDSTARRHTSIDEYVAQLFGFVTTLGMLPPHLVGHGLGGVVAVRAAHAYPGCFGKVMIAGTPLVGAALQPAAKPTALSRLLGRSGANELWARLVREAANGDTAFAEVIEDIEATSPAVLQRVLDELRTIDLRPHIDALEQPLLAVYGARDQVLPAQHAQHLSTHPGSRSQALIFERSGHFPFLDQPVQFNRALLDFLTSDDVAVAVKEVWKRRVSQREFL